MNDVQFLIGAVFVVMGLLTMMFAVFGIFRFSFALNRMHSGAIGDTLGLGTLVIGLCILSGFSVTTLKLLLVVFFFWCTGPVSSHLLARLIVTTDEHIDQYAPEKNKNLKERQGNEDGTV